MKRRSILAAGALAATLPAIGRAQGLNTSKTLRIVAPVPAGGPLDVQARALALQLGGLLGMTVIVDNKPGAATMIGAAEVARSAPDGLTLLYTADHTTGQVPHTLLKPPLDVMKDLVPVARASTVQWVLFTHPSVPGTTVRELIDYAKQNPGKLSYASVGVGSSFHYYGEVLARIAKLDVTHVPYNGVAPIVGDLLEGRIHFTFNSPALVSQYVPSGKLKVIANTGDKRSKLLPNLPTMREQGYQGFDPVSWTALFAPAGTNEEVLAKLRGALSAALKQPPVIAVFKQQGFEVLEKAETPAETSKIIQTDYQRWGAMLKEIGIKQQ